MSSEEVENREVNEEEIEEKERKPFLTISGSGIILSFFYDNDRDRVSISIAKRNEGKLERVGSVRIDALIWALKNYRIVRDVKKKYIEDIKEFVE